MAQFLTQADRAAELYEFAGDGPPEDPAVVYVIYCEGGCVENCDQHVRSCQVQDEVVGLSSQVFVAHYQPDHTRVANQRYDDENGKHHVR